MIVVRRIVGRAGDGGPRSGEHCSSLRLQTFDHGVNGCSECLTALAKENSMRNILGPSHSCIIFGAFCCLGRGVHKMRYTSETNNHDLDKPPDTHLHRAAESENYSSH